MSNDDTDHDTNDHDTNDHGSKEHGSNEHGSNEEQAAAQPLVDHRLDGRLVGWGPNEALELTPAQAARLQEHDEQVADADFGGLLKGDLGRTESAQEPSEAVRTAEPDTSLGHQGGSRYEEYAAGDGEQA